MSWWKFQQLAFYYCKLFLHYCKLPFTHYSSVLKHPHPLKNSICLSLQVLRIFNRSCLPPYAMTIVLLSRGKHKLPKQLIDIRHHYNPPLSTALCHYNTSSSKGPKFSVNPVLCWNIFFSFSFIPQWPPLLRIKINASFWRNIPVSGLEPKYWCKGITGWH